MKNAKWILPLVTALIALPVCAQPLVLEDIASADVKAQIYENQMAETSGASSSMQMDAGGPTEDMHTPLALQDDTDSAGKPHSASSAKEPATAPKVAANEHAGANAAHPEKPVDKSQHKRVHFVKQPKKKTS